MGYEIATSDGVTKLREPLSLALTSLSDLESHMAKQILASQRLTSDTKRPRRNPVPLLRALSAYGGWFPLGGA
jgi:hypothetical protein